MDVGGGVYAHHGDCSLGTPPEPPTGGEVRRTIPADSKAAKPSEASLKAARRVVLEMDDRGGSRDVLVVALAIDAAVREEREALRKRLLAYFDSEGTAHEEDGDGTAYEETVGAIRDDVLALLRTTEGE